jgi:hypothetical protein
MSPQILSDLDAFPLIGKRAILEPVADGVSGAPGSLGHLISGPGLEQDHHRLGDTRRIGPFPVLRFAKSQLSWRLSSYQYRNTIAL